MVDLDLSLTGNQTRNPRVCAVSYLNTTPLVWGMLEGPQRGLADLSFAIPSICTERVVERAAEIGLLPVIEVARNAFEWVRGAGIACRGAVRSILLASRVPFGKIRTLATDTGSRTSVELARIILTRRFGVDPALVPMRPDLPAMLEAADAALLIGDAALAIEPARLDCACLDLGEQWLELTGLPMVFAVWAGRKADVNSRTTKLLLDSARYGLDDIDRIVAVEAERRGFTPAFVKHYLTRHLVHLLGAEEERGMNAYLRYVSALNPVAVEKTGT